MQAIIIFYGPAKYDFQNVGVVKQFNNLQILPRIDEMLILTFQESNFVGAVTMVQHFLDDLPVVFAKLPGNTMPEEFDKVLDGEIIEGWKKVSNDWTPIISKL